MACGCGIATCGGCGYYGYPYGGYGYPYVGGYGYPYYGGCGPYYGGCSPCGPCAPVCAPTCGPYGYSPYYRRC